jgi:hypothetical protein
MPYIKNRNTQIFIYFSGNYKFLTSKQDFNTEENGTFLQVYLLKTTLSTESLSLSLCNNNGYGNNRKNI